MFKLMGSLIKYVALSLAILISAHFITIGGMTLHQKIGQLIVQMQGLQVVGNATQAIKKLADDAKVGVKTKVDIPEQDQRELKKLLQSKR